MAKELKPLVIPATLGACADLLFKLRAARLVQDKLAADMKAQETELTNHLINTLPKSQAEGVTGKFGKVKILQKNVPQVKDWDAFQKYILKTKDFSLLQRRAGDAAIKERWDSGKTVPGVEAFTVTTLSITKA
jgi:hypothetical protein